jgi:hypothetical protein
MKEALEKLIRRVVLPKYVWIKNFDISVSKNKSYNLYHVSYYVDDDIYDSLYDGDRKKINRIKSETKNLFTVLGPDKYDLFEGVAFFSDKHDRN